MRTFLTLFKLFSKAKKYNYKTGKTEKINFFDKLTIYSSILKANKKGHYEKYV